VDVQKDCAKDTIAINAAVADATYYFNYDDVTYTPTWTTRFIGCAKTCSYGQTTDPVVAAGNIITGFSVATGAVTVNTNDVANFDRVASTITVACLIDDS